MAILSQKPNEEETIEVTTSAVTLVQPTKRFAGGLVVPRLSEKAGAMDKLNKYIFTVHGKMNKVEVRKTIEKQYGVKIAQVNMIVVQGKARRFRNQLGRTSNYKKAIVTLTPDSKKINLVEPS